MADTIVVKGVRQYEGEYVFDLADEPLTTLEWRWIKKISGYLPLTIEDGWVGLDPDLILSFGIIAMRRAGKIDKDRALVVAEQLEDGAEIKMILGGADADPLQAPETDEPSGTSGEPSSQTSGLPGPTPSPTGSLDSERSAVLDPRTLAI